jgi:hypothetical protein
VAELQAQGAPKNYDQKQIKKTRDKGGSVGWFYVGLRFFGLFCKNMAARHFDTTCEVPAPP